jgi:anti-sigma regulatory factor (Ser/Thr protein kinase)
MDVRARTTLPATVATPAAARAFARDALAGEEPAVRVEDLVLVVSELVTNAVVHGAGDVTLVVGVGDDGGVQVEVADDEPAMPERLRVPVDAESGRGLLLVSRLARRWGVRGRGDVGKVVWAELAG